MNHLIADGGHAARFFPAGATIDVCRGDDLKVVQTHVVLLSVWRSDGTAVVYFDA